MDKIQNLLLNYLKEEKMDDYDGIGKGELIYTYKMQLFIITCKSLSYKRNGIGIDYNRFSEEINLLKYYLNGANESLESFFNGKLSGFEDDSVLYRILPIIIANKDINIIEEEIIKNVSITSRNPKTFLKGLTAVYIIREYLENDKIDVDKVKESLINLSITKYLDNYKFMDKNFILNFEKERIDVISKITTNLKNIYEGTFNIVENMEGKIIKDNYYKLISDFSEYLKNLKDGKLKIEKYNDNNKENKRIKVSEGNTFDHYLLGKSKIVKNDKSYFYIKTKYGLFKFNKIRWKNENTITWNEQ